MIVPEQHLQLVKRVATRIARRLPRQVQLDDLLSAGHEGLLDAARRFDPRKGVAFGAYAEIRIRGAVMDELRTLDFAPRSLRRRHRERAQSLGGLDASRFSSAANELAPHFVSTDEPDAQELPDPAALAEQQLEHRQELDELRAAVASLPERLQRVLALYYVEELTLKEIGAELGVTESRVCQLHGRAVSSIREAIEERQAEAA